MELSNFINGLDYQTFFNIIDNLYDEILIYDKNLNVVYINQACCRHYALTPDAMIGKNFYDMIGDSWWTPSVLPMVIKERRAFAIKQQTYMGVELLTIAVPIFNRDHEIEFVAMNVRDNINAIDLVNPHYIVEQESRYDIVPPIAESASMQQVLRLVKKVSKLSAPCLISGEVGVGKSMIARYMHSISNFAVGTFVIIQCDRAQANDIINKIDEIIAKGTTCTLFLSNICYLDKSGQMSLIEKLQCINEQNLPIRVLSSTNKNLKELIISNQFLEELYFMVNITEVYVPPLRKRREDIVGMIYAFSNLYATKYGINRQFTQGAIQALRQAEWGSNARELKHTIERLFVMSEGLHIDVDALPKSIFGIVDMHSIESHTPESFDEKMKQYESLLVRDAYEKHQTSRAVAQYLGISQSKANNLIRKHILK